MKWRSIGAAIVLAVFASVSLLNLTTQSSLAQQSPPNFDPRQKVVDIHFENVPIARALKELFKLNGAAYKVDDDVQGTVTVTLRKVAFETALQNVLKQVEATWREHDGVYQILLKPQDSPYIQPDLDPKETVDIRIAINDLFRSMGAAVAISPEIRGKVRRDKQQNMAFEAALHNLLKQVNATYRVDRGIYEIFPRPSIKVEPKPEKHSSPIRSSSNGNEGPVITQDSRYLYILKGNLIYKVNKSDLKTVKKGRLGS